MEFTGIFTVFRNSNGIYQELSEYPELSKN